MAYLQRLDSQAHGGDLFTGLQFQGGSNDWEEDEGEEFDYDRKFVHVISEIACHVTPLPDQVLMLRLPRSTSIPRMKMNAMHRGFYDKVCLILTVYR